MAFKSRILVVDDDPEVCDVAAEMLRDNVHLAVATETDPQKAIGLVKGSQFDLILTDLIMGDHSGMEMLEAALEADPDTVVVFMTGYPTVENATQALKCGAYDFLVKPFQLEQLLATVERGLRKLQLSRENIRLKEQLALFKIAEAMGLTIHLSTALNQVLKLIMKEFNVEAASILLFDSSKPAPFVMQALQTRSGIDRSFLEWKTNHSLMAVKSKIVEIENVYASSKVAEDILEQDRITTYLSCPLLIRGRVIGVLNMQRANVHHEFATGELQSLKVIASKAAYAISNSKLYDDLEKAYLSTIMALANAVEARDRYTSGHTVRVTYLAELIAKEFGWDEERMFILSMGCSLHDIGKIGVPDSILNKPGFLNQREMSIMRKHTELGARIIEGIDFLKPCQPYITAHHEWWDGSGYPSGLKDEGIPKEGRILAVADSFDAMVTDRPYRRSRSIEQAVQELVDFSGRQFDPAIVEIFLEALKKHREKIEVIYGAAVSDCSIKTVPVKT
ncbi:MAG: response regulator [Candidatus Zixiibacteriota bacterium]|nr:MAG: response regulator [candidate division Zixibacteria bacterium]